MEKEIRTCCLQPMCIQTLTLSSYKSDLRSSGTLRKTWNSSLLLICWDNLLVPFSRVACCWRIFQEMKKNTMSQSHLQPLQTAWNVMLSTLSPDLMPCDLHFHRQMKENATDTRGQLEKHISSPRREKCGLCLGRVS